ncbi:MAG: hypothetical protein KGY56_10825 [Desulfobacterales bacterium]|nr:hypothetical protein [Desulfobacterales bacterium]
MKGFSHWKKKPMVNITRDMITRRHKKLGQFSHARANFGMRYLEWTRL